MFLTTACVLALAGSALAHGGQYRGGGPAQSGPSVPPGTADRPTTQTSWETWWSANKEFHLRLHERMRDDGAAVTPGTNGGPDRAQKRAEEDAAKRAELAPVFLEALADPSFEVRTAAAIALGKLGDTRASEPLRTAARKDDHKDVRDAALLAVAMLGGEQDVPYLVDVLMDRDESTRHRSFAAFGLGLIGGEDAAAMLLRLVEGGGPSAVGVSRLDPPLAASAYVALGLTGCDIVLPAVREAAAEHADDNVRAFAILSLGRLGDGASRDAVTGFLNHEKDANVRRSSAITLGKIATADHAEAVKALRRALDDADPVTRHFAAVALGEMADASVCGELARALPKAPAMDRPFYALALGLARHVPAAPLIRGELSRERDENVRSGYCIALGLLGDAAAVPLLQDCAKERGEIWLPGYAALSLGMIGSRESAPILRERLDSEKDPRLSMNVAVALGLLHDPVARAHLVGRVRDRDGSIYERGAAAMALGVLRLNDASDDLLAVYRDRKEQDLVRALAVVALGVLADPSPVPKLARFAIDHNYGVSVDPLNEVLSIL